jgi:hypothetical protein
MITNLLPANSDYYKRCANKPNIKLENITEYIPESYLLYGIDRLSYSNYTAEATTLRKIMAGESVAKTDVNKLLAALNRVIAEEESELRRMENNNSDGMEKIAAENSILTIRKIANTIRQLRMQAEPRY